MKNKILLYIPIVVLLLWLVSVQQTLHNAQTVIMPVGGYDPRDLLSGHYLRIQTQYPAATGLSGFGQTIYFCVDDSKLSFGKPENCGLFIAGKNNYGRFDDGISRFYVPEKKALPLERLLRDRSRKAEIVLAVDKNGRVHAKDLLFDGKSWKEIQFPDDRK